MMEVNILKHDQAGYMERAAHIVDLYNQASGRAF